MHKPFQADLGYHPSTSKNELMPSDGMPRFGPGSSLLRITEPPEIRNRPAGGTTTRRAELESGPQRLKLKDYLHLASMEKKSKSRSLRADSRIENKSNASCELKKSTEQSLTMQSEPDMDEMIRQDIEKRIEEQLSQLKDLRQFVNTAPHAGKTTNQKNILLFAVFNAIKTNAQALEEVGEKINQFQAEGAGNEPYYWRQSKRESPAKILKRGLEMTYNLTTLLAPPRRTQ